MTNEEEELRLFGQQVASVRKRQGLSQQELAERLGVHLVSIGRIETGQRWPRLSFIYSMAEVLNVDVIEFFRHTEKGQ